VTPIANPNPNPNPNPTGPLIVVCLRHVDLRPEVDPLTGQVRRDARSARPAPGEEAALEHALRLAEAWGGRVLAVCAGPPAAAATLRLAVAVGAEALRVDVGSEADSDPRHAAPPARRADGGRLAAEPLGGLHAYLQDLAGDGRAVARAVVAAALAHTGRTPSLVLAGDRSADRGIGTLPAMIAHELGAVQALGLVGLRPDPDRPAAALLAERRLDRGYRELLRVPLPAVCSVEAAGLRLRRATLPAVLLAEAAEIPAAVAVVPVAPVAPVVPVALGAEADPSADPTDQPAAEVTRLPLGPVVVSARPLRPRTRVVAPPSGTDPMDRLRVLTGAATVHEPPTVVGPVDAGEAADVLLDFLRLHGYLQLPDLGADGEPRR
jgi:electron transfer flavoprotein beta subunit